MEAYEVARKAARAFYLREEKKNPGGYPYGPADATRAAEKKSGVPFSRLVPVVAAVYYEENGKRAPISGTGKTLAKNVAKARAKTGTRFARWEVIAASVEAGTGKRLSIPAIRALAVAGGTVLDSSYAGRGTRIAAPKTKTDELAEVGE